MRHSTATLASTGACSAIATLLRPEIIDELANTPVLPKEARGGLPFSMRNARKIEGVRKEIVQLSHHPMIIENFPYSGVIFGSEIGRSIQLSEWRS
jgi:hypothetical protein